MVTNHHDSLLQSPSYTARGFVETVNWNLKGAKKTNENFRLSIAAEEERSARFRQSEEERKKRLEEVRDRLKFD
jgi:hypothetical protein